MHIARRWPRRRRGRALGWLLALSLLLAGAASGVAGSPARAATTVVGCGDTGALITAMEQAADGDTLQISCVYTLTMPYLSQGETGLPVITKQLTLKGDGATISRRSGAASFRLIEVAESGDLRLDGVTLSSGKADGRGGAIYNAGGSVTMTGGALYNNTADYEGGGIYTLGGTVTLSGTSLGGNRSSSSGGGIAAYQSVVTITGGVLNSNTADYDGGVIFAQGGAIAVADSTMESNRANQGGGISVVDAALSLTGSTLTVNHADVRAGGAIYGQDSTVAVAESTLSDNTAQSSGGGIALSGGTLALTSSTLERNQANVGGGGIAVVNEGVVTVDGASELSGNFAQNAGGGIRAEWSAVTVTGGSLLHENQAGWGGGISIDGGSVAITGASTLSDNLAQVSGGGVEAMQASVTVTRGSVLSNNTANNDSGGGIFASNSTVTVSRGSVLEQNHAFNYGSGIYVDGGCTLTVSESTLSANSGRASGAGIYAKGGTTKVTVTNSTLSNNETLGSGSGGGIFSDGASLAVTGSTLSGNVGGVVGGAVYASDTSVQLVNNTLTGNTAYRGAAVAIASSEITVTNSTLSGNNADEGGDNMYLDVSSTATLFGNILIRGARGNCHSEVGGVIADDGYNLATDTTCSLTGNGSQQNLTAAALALGLLADNGGPTRTMAPGAGSPAIDVIPSENCAVNLAASRIPDQRGTRRPQGAGCDAGAFEAGGAAQTLTFPQPADRTYGDAPFVLQITSTASSYNDIITLESETPEVCTDAGQRGNLTVTIVGAGECVVTASQAGGLGWQPAWPVTRSFTVSRADLTITADDQTITPGSAIPALSWTGSGFVAGEGPANLLRQPTCISPARQRSPDNTYPITCLGAASGNYDIVYVPGTLTIAQASQSISFDQPVGATYGDAPRTLAASATSGLPVSFSATPGTVCTVAGDQLTIQGAGDCTVTASQAGDQGWAAAADVEHTFTVVPKPLTIAAAAKKMTYGQTPPALTTYTSAFAYDEGVDDLAGALTCQIERDGSTVPLTSQTPTGSYDIVCGGLSSANYAITWLTGKLTIAKASQTITFVQPATVTYGDGPITLSATATSGLSVAYASEDTAICTVDGAGVVTIAGAGSCAITASQAGDENWLAAEPVTKRFAVDKATLTLAADDQTMVYGGPVPTWTVQFTGFVNGDDRDDLDGTLACLIQDAQQQTVDPVTAPVGSYAIVCDGFSSPNYTLVPVPGTLTITPRDASVTLDPATSAPVVVDARGRVATLNLRSSVTVPQGNPATALPVTYTLTPLGGGSDLTCVDSTGAGVTGQRLASSCTLTGVPPGRYTLTVTAGSNYQGTITGTVIVVDPLSGMVSGGGLVQRGMLSLSAMYAGPRLTGSLNYLRLSRDGMVFLRTQRLTSLVVTGQTIYLEGEATLNGRSGYRVLLTAIDKPGRQRDQVQLQVWDSSGTLVDQASFDLSPLQLGWLYHWGGR